MKTTVAGNAKIIGTFSDLDRHFADFVLKVARTDNEELWLAAALVSLYTQEGHVCLDLASMAGRSIGPEEAWSVRCPDLQRWLGALRQSSVVGAPGDFRPLILDKAHRLYLYRYWQYETKLAEFLKEHFRRDPGPLDLESAKSSLVRLFPQQPSSEINWQRVAAMTALQRNLCVITGGPGTGKTSTVVRILALLVEHAAGTRLTIGLAAPTGKAAGRLKEAVKDCKPGLACAPEVLAQIPEEAFTLHRLLGPLAGSLEFRHHRDNPVPYDVIVVDEASMVDLPLMAKLTQAIPSQSRLILLGDKDQLASVEPGAVFGDICASAQPASATGTLDDLIAGAARLQMPVVGEPQRPLGDSIIVLRKSYRFDEASGIGRFSQLIHAGNPQAVEELLKTESSDEVGWKRVRSLSELQSYLETWVIDAYAKYLRTNDPVEAFPLFETCRILCALRKGPYGVVAVNQLVESILERAGLIRRRGRWYRGQPVVISRNDYALRLFNGDVGLILEHQEGKEENNTRLRAFFPAEDGTFRAILPMKLPEHETVYAMTVHKAQGSEFDRVLLILPDRWSEVLSRELIYTAVTRARRQVEVWGSLEILGQSIGQKIDRRSGLQDALIAADEAVREE
jgi:exodeoxyribonuclease V alpha subunit